MVKKIGLVGITAAATAALVIACSDGTTPSSIVCSTNDDCRVGEICHPDAKVCVQTCETGEDCPDASKNCDVLSDTDSQKICKCTTSVLCQGGVAGADSICSETFDVCTPKCASSLDCGSGLECDTATGECKPGATDAGSDAGTCSWDTCSSTGWGSGAQTCTANGCEAGASCSGTGQTSCNYGEYCAGGSCGYPTFPTATDCENFHSGSHASGPVWNPNSSTGPVIYSVTELSHGEGGTTGFAECTAGNTEWIISIRAYRTDMDWPDTRAGLSGFKYVKVNGTDQDILATPTLLKPNTGYNRNSADKRDAEFQVYLCASNAQNDIQPGFYFVGGNEACRQF